MVKWAEKVKSHSFSFGAISFDFIQGFSIGVFPLDPAVRVAGEHVCRCLARRIKDVIFHEAQGVLVKDFWTPSSSKPSRVASTWSFAIYTYFHL